jgi:hypothetical protein
VIGVIAVFFKYLSAFLSRRPGNQWVINHPVITPAEKRESQCSCGYSISVTPITPSNHKGEKQ